MEYLYNFISQTIGVSQTELTPETSLRKDLKLYGDEAVDFLEAFCENFNVDIKEFNFKKYFDTEQDEISKFIFSFFKSTEKKDLTINDLNKAIKTKVLT